MGQQGTAGEGKRAAVAAKAQAAELTPGQTEGRVDVIWAGNSFISPLFWPSRQFG